MSLQHPDADRDAPQFASGPRPFDAEASFEPRGPLLWMTLWFLPGRFFDHFGRSSRPLLTAAAVIAAGFVSAANRIDTRRAMAELSNPSSAASLPATWTDQWALIVVGGLFLGVITYAIGGWWHRLRLRWCGVEAPDPFQSRQVYMIAKLVIAVPALALLVYTTIAFATPEAAYQADIVLDWFVMPTVFWAAFANYRAVRVVFEARRGPAIAWFLVVPWVFYAIVIGVVFAAVFVAAFTQTTTSALMTPRPFRAATWTFEHPVGWPVDSDHADYNPESFVRLAADPDGWFEIERYHSTITPSEEVAVTLDTYAADFGPMRPSGDFTDWSGMTGDGRVATGQWQGLPIRFRIFATALDDGTMFEVREAWLVRDEQQVRRGFEMIRNSFALHPLGPDATLTPEAFRSEAWSFDYPSEWSLDSDDSTHDPESFVYIVAVPDGWFHAMRYDTVKRPGVELLATREGLTDNFGPLTWTGEVSEWAGHEGVGASYAGQWEGLPLTITVFILNLSDGTTLEVREGWFERDRATVTPGLDMIRSSFSLAIPPVPTAADSTPPPVTDPPY